MKHACILVSTITLGCLLLQTANAQPNQVLLETQFIEVNESNVSDLGIEGGFASLSQMVTVNSSMGPMRALQGAQIFNPVGSGNDSEVSVSFLNDTGQVPFSYTDGMTGTVAFAALFFDFSPLDASSNPTLQVVAALSEAPMGFADPVFDARDINGERVFGTLMDDGRVPNGFIGMVDFDSNPNFDSSSITAMGITFLLESQSDAFASFDSVLFAGVGAPAVPEPGAAILAVFGVAFFLGRRRR